MKRFTFPILLLVLAGLSSSAREISSFNSDWKFDRYGTMPDGSERAEPEGLAASDLDDSGWRTLDVPHDWGIEGPFRLELPNQTGKLPWAGIGWYRKSFDSPQSDAGKKVYLDIDGAMSGATVYLNGQQVGEWPYGYASFRVDLTPALRVGESNALAIRLDNKAFSSRWYPGGGIYRNVWLVKANPVHVAQWGVFVTTPVVSSEEATVKIETRIEGDASATVSHAIMEKGSDEVVVTGSGTTAWIKLPSPRIWDLDHPNLYEVKTTLSVDGVETDSVTNTFGVRTIKYTADEGFFLNGKLVRMNGVCQHHDLGPLGAALNVRAKERQIEILKEMGVNAIRTAHNPPAPELLDLCDRMGILVQSETFDAWGRKKAENDYARHFWDWWERDTVALVRRDRNHPSVVMWSTGNEILEMNYADEAWISQMQTDVMRREDPTRPVSFGGSRPIAAFNGFQNTIDVYGFNYKPHLYAEFKEKNPDIPLYSSESASTVSSRGEYFFPVILDDKFKGNGGYFQVSSYDYFAPNWAYRPDIEFEAQDKYPWVFGEFVWTGFDYLGEPTPYNKDKTNLLNFTDPAEIERMKKQMEELGGNIPPRSSYFGIVDLCGFKKDRFYLYQARWRPNLPMAHILPHWNWPERVGKVTPVHVYTSGDEAELFLNGKSLGRKKKGQYEYRLRWDDVVYEPGELVVKTWKDGKPWVQADRKTTGEAKGLRLTVDRNRILADGKDLAFVTVDVVDADGQVVPRTHHKVRYSMKGPAEIVATGNGDPTNLTSFSSKERKVFNGKALVIVKGLKQGWATLTAEAEGLETAEINIIPRKKL